MANRLSEIVGLSCVFFLLGGWIPPESRAGLITINTSRSCVASNDLHMMDVQVKSKYITYSIKGTKEKFFSSNQRHRPIEPWVPVLLAVCGQTRRLPCRPWRLLPTATATQKPRCNLRPQRVPADWFADVIGQNDLPSFSIPSFKARSNADAVPSATKTPSTSRGPSVVIRRRILSSSPSAFRILL